MKRNIDNAFSVEDYPDDEVAMICDDEYEARSFELHLHSLGKTWNTGRRYDYVSHATYSTKPIAYFFNKGTFSDSYSRDKTIIQGKALYYRDFYWGDDDIQISVEDIEALIGSAEV